MDGNKPYIHETEDNVVGEEQESLQVKAKKKKYTQQFSAAWLSHKMFKDWFEKKIVCYVICLNSISTTQ